MTGSCEVPWTCLNLLYPGNARCFNASFGEGARDRLTFLMREAMTPAVVSSCFILINLAQTNSDKSMPMPVRITTKRMDCQGVSNLVSMTCTALKRVLRCRICCSIFRGVAKWHNLRGVWFGQRSQPWRFDGCAYWLIAYGTVLLLQCFANCFRSKCRRKTSLARKLFQAKLDFVRHTPSELVKRCKCFVFLLQENEGFGVIMKNFNHERWGFVVQERRRECAY